MRNEGHSTFLKNSLFTIVRQGTSIVIGLLLLMVLARVLGPAGQGRYTVVTMLPILFMTFLNMGLNVSTIYFVSKKEFDVKSAVFHNTLFGVGIGVLGMGIGILVILLFPSYFQEVPTASIYLGLLALPFMLLNIFYQTIYQGLQDFKMFNIALVVTQCSTLFFVLIMLVFLNFGLKGALISFILGHLTTFVFHWVVFKRKYHLKFKGQQFSWLYFKKNIYFGVKAHLSNVITVLNYRTAILMIIFFLSPAAVGIYSVAVNLAERMSVFSQSISSVLMPQIAHLEDEHGQNQLTSAVSRGMVVFMLAGTLIVILLANGIIEILFGAQFEESAEILEILLPGIAFLSVEKILSNDIAGRGKPELNMYVSIINVIINVSLNLIFIPEYGLQGAAIAATVTYFLSFMIKSVIFKNLTGIPYRNFLIMSKRDIHKYLDLFREILGKVIK